MMLLKSVFQCISTLLQYKDDLAVQKVQLKDNTVSRPSSPYNEDPYTSNYGI